MSQEFEIIGPAPVQRFSALIPFSHGLRVTDGDQPSVEFRFKNPVTLGGRPSVTVWNEATGAAVTGHGVRMDGGDIVIRLPAGLAAEMTALSVTIIG
ncbi:hypothetical protein [Actinoplanes flavus]|uniref:Uncharacterized protein n=1 Tax=Actinoplanes flavus TaxID=2820290 RepID=A0ABS3UIL8_9ACTN|nr:hypothetical protein [Actinoplanes flavus]MBO3738627.1 hypothetical protein [Actinoplanes flavus]